MPAKSFIHTHGVSWQLRLRAAITDLGEENERTTLRFRNLVGYNFQRFLAWKEFSNYNK
jgi:hypothetical protein